MYNDKPSAHGISKSHDKFVDRNVWLRSSAVKPAANAYTESNINAGSVYKKEKKKKEFLKSFYNSAFLWICCNTWIMELPFNILSWPMLWNFLICSNTSVTRLLPMSTKRNAVILTPLYLKSSKSYVSISCAKSYWKERNIWFCNRLIILGIVLEGKNLQKL